MASRSPKLTSTTALVARYGVSDSSPRFCRQIQGSSYTTVAPLRSDRNPILHFGCVQLLYSCPICCRLPLIRNVATRWRCSGWLRRGCHWTIASEARLVLGSSGVPVHPSPGTLPPKQETTRATPPRRQLGRQPSRAAEGGPISQ